MNEWTVYRHIFPNGKSYIGITSQKPEYRWGKQGKNYSMQPLVYNAIKKYGWDNIKHLILFRELTADEANKKEQELIKEYHSYYLDELGPGYNMTLGGEGSKQIDSKIIIEMYNNGLNTYQIADAIKHDRAVIASILHANGIQIRGAAKPINQFELNGHYIATYSSAQEAESITKIDRKLISGTIRGITKSSGGYQWRYYDEKDLNGIPSIKHEHWGTKLKPIEQYSLNGEYIKTFESIAAAAKEIGCERSNIRAAAQGKTKYSHGYKWKYSQN